MSQDRYFAIVDDEHDVANPLTVVYERQATGEFETYTANLKWEPGAAEGRRVPITLVDAIAFENTMAERVREKSPYRYYAIVTGDHPDVAAPAALVRQHLCARCLPADEVYRQDGRWVETNTVIAIRAGERPGEVVPITEQAAAGLRATWTPRPVLEREPISRPLFRYYAVVSGTHPAEDPLTVVRVHDDTEESYTPALRWEQTAATGERVPISAAAALRFEETQFRRVFGDARFQYYAAVSVFHPDPEDPASVVRVVTDELGTVVKENHGTGHQWTYLPWSDGHTLVPVPAEKAAQLREICDSRPVEPRYHYRGWLNNPTQDTPDTLSRYWDDLGAIRRQEFKNGGWHDVDTGFNGPVFLKSAHFLHPIDIEAVRRFEAQGHYDPPPPVREYTYYALIDDSCPRPRPLRGLLRTWQERKCEREEQFSAYDRSWSTSYVREDVSRGKKDFLFIDISEAEALQAQETLVERRKHFENILAAHTYYAIIDAEHPLRDAPALIRTWPTRDGERVEEYSHGSGYGTWEPRTGRPAGEAIELTESLRRRLEQRAYERHRNA